MARVDLHLLGAVLLASCGRIDFAPATQAVADAAPAPVDGPPCPATFTPSGGSCYLVVANTPVAGTWQELEARCEASEPGAHLAVIEDEAELDHLIAIIRTAGMADAVVGFSDLVTEGTFLTVVGSPAFLRWAPGDPDGDDCGAIQATPGTEGTEDTVCTGLDDYVCEADGRAVDPSAF
ncbi:MAG: C-type lectin domain-containing protein [Kofleriaceae bacterium]|nr:C-type lectin domain-containing protein [Kofleriaceae bacterium]MBP6837721.1 C-type lectin domain-containing protein [Kofleriaceae bacterium]MBP9205051.1 C-type lectin domain-containing protein [Kofleriaceae bacterium]